MQQLRPAVRLRRWLALVAVVGLTAFSVIFGASTAQALHNGTFSPQELKFIQGGVKAAAPKVAARSAVAGAVCGGTLGVGCVALAVIGIGMLAYDTREIWLPWVKGQMGEGSDPTEPGEPGSIAFMNWRYPTESNGVTGTATSTAALNLAVLVTWNSAIGGSASYQWTVNCRKPDGTQYLMTATKGWPIPNAGTPVPVVQTIGPNNLFCSGGIGDRVMDARVSSAHGGVIEYHATMPVTSVETVLTCRRPDGSTYTVITTTENPTDQVKVGHCAAGDTPVNLSTTGTVNGQPVPQWNVPLAPWDATSDGEYPLCAGASTSCVYRIAVDGEFCAAGIEKCTHWSYVYTQTPSRVECFWGPYSIAVDHCYFMERAYDLANGARIVTAPNTDGNPLTWSGDAPYPARSGTNPSSSPTPSTSTSVGQPSPSVTASTPTIIPKDPLVTMCTSTAVDAGGLQPEAVQLANKLDSLFNIESIGGYRDPSGDKYGEHSSGLALDLMTYSNSTKGQAIADYLQNNATTLRVRWIIWEQHVWSAERADEGWRLMEDRGSPTQNHMDHVHVLIYDTTLAGIPDGASCGGDPSNPSAGGGCLSKAASWNPVDWVYWPTRCVLEWAFIPPGGDAFFGDKADQLGAQFLASPVGQWFGLGRDVENSLAGIESGGGGAATFAQLRAEGDVIPTGETYDGASVVMTLAAPAGEGTASAQALEDFTWHTGGGSACSGPAVDLSALETSRMPSLDLPSDWRPFSACTGDMAQVAATSQLIITAMVGFAVFWTTLRQLGAAFGFNVVAGEMGEGDSGKATSDQKYGKATK